MGAILSPIPRQIQREKVTLTQGREREKEGETSIHVRPGIKLSTVSLHRDNTSTLCAPSRGSQYAAVSQTTSESPCSAEFCGEYGSPGVSTCALSKAAMGLSAAGAGRVSRLAPCCPSFGGGTKAPLAAPQAWLLTGISGPRPRGEAAASGRLLRGRWGPWSPWLESRPNTSGPREPGMTLGRVCLLAVLLKFHSLI